MAKPVIKVLVRTLLDTADPANDEHFKIIISSLLEIYGVEDVARMCDTSQPIIKRWARGEPGMDSRLRPRLYKWLAEDMDKTD